MTWHTQRTGPTVEAKAAVFSDRDIDSTDSDSLGHKRMRTAMQRTSNSRVVSVQVEMRGPRAAFWRARLRCFWLAAEIGPA